jgi:hypothetical protein
MGEIAMPEITYDRIPTVAQFKKDSSVTFALRGNDRILSHLDWLLERFHSNHGPNVFRPHVIACDLFVTANYWIKSYHQNNPRMLKERYPAVLALFASTVDQLALMFGCARKRLNTGDEVKPTMWGELEVQKQMVEIFGKEIVPDKAESDLADGAKHYEASELALHRIRFREGRAYKYQATEGGTLRLQPVNSRDYYLPATRPGAGAGIKYWAPFVMTQEREFYMSKHTSGIYHSAYTRGGPVSCAGTMLIKNGVIRGLRPDSGHYQPLDQNAIAALIALRMFGVNLHKTIVLDWSDDKAKKPMKAIEYMRGNISWAKYTKTGARALADGGYE